MQIIRLFEIVYFLINRKSVTAGELAEHFEVSKRTILRDIDTLSAAGIPIYTTQGKGGGISIMDNYVLNKALISEEEQNQILFALQSMSVTQTLNSDNVLGKLQKLFLKNESNWIEVDFSRWGDKGSDKEKFELLKNAIINRTALKITYSSSYGQTSERTVYPLKLTFKSHSWYLQAFCRPKDNYRTFKVNRIRKIEPLSEVFESTGFAIPDITGNEAPTETLSEVRLLFPQRMAYRIYDEFSDENITYNDDGTYSVTMQIPLDNWIFSYILSFGDDVDVLAPQGLRDELAILADKIKDKYKAKT